MTVLPEATSVRVDAWTWSVRLFPTRSAASTACKAGHVRVNGTSAKPAQSVKLGDTIRIRTTRGERIVVVTGLIQKRTSATLAVENYEDRTPVILRSEPGAALGTRERGAGRPTKRDRRLVERLRGRD
jgi:ribosome-associated heat shock protein Hsp15